MKCEECLLVIEEYVDGDLEERDAGRVTAHLAACNSCAAISEDLTREQEIYSYYQRDVEVTPALWNGIKTRIEEENAGRSFGILTNLRELFAQIFRAPRFSPALAAALVLVTVGITVVVMRYITPNNSPSIEQADPGIAKYGENPNEKEETAKGSQGSGGANEGNPIKEKEVQELPPVASNSPRPVKRQPKLAKAPTPEELVRQAEEKYLAAIAILSEDVKKRREQLDPNSLEQFQLVLASIDQTIAETRRAVRQYPEDPVAVQYMMTAYAKKVEVLREMAGY
jgi:hypothetical protein